MTTNLKVYTRFSFCLRSIRVKDKTPLITDISLLTIIAVFMAVYFDIRYLFYDTVVTGGDTASWQGIAHHMLTVLLPNGRLTGWDFGNFCGYPNFNFYFIPPFLLAVLPSFLFGFPLTITLKLAIVSGIFLLPLMTYFGLREMGYRFPVPVIGSSVSLVFLFNESYTMFGANTLSTFAGQFCYMFAFALFAYFMGSLYRGIEDESRAIRNGVLLGIIGMSHLFLFIPAVFLLVYFFFAKGKVRYLLKISLLAFGIMAFWLLPLIAYRPYTTKYYMIWQDFVSWRHTFMGLGIILLFIGPRLSIAALKKPSINGKFREGWGFSMICFSALGAFVFIYLTGGFLALGEGLWASSAVLPDFSVSPLGKDFAAWLHPLIVPCSLFGALFVFAAGIWFFRKKRENFEKFCLANGAVSFLVGGVLVGTGVYVIICRSISDESLRLFFLQWQTFAGFCCILLIPATWLLFFSGRFSKFVHQIAIENEKTDRFWMLSAIVCGCLVGYFSAHFLNMPDVRFLPPLIFALLLIFFVDTLQFFFSLAGHQTKVAGAIAISYLCILVVIFGAVKSDKWFRFNNKGYEFTRGYQEFMAANNYLKNVYSKKYHDPLNAPRVGYEKCDLYGPFGGDRVFESMPYFAQRQTMEGIHYSSSIASKFITFLQTEYSRDIKTPRGYILSRMNPEALPAHLDLYNISQLILMTDKAKKAMASCPFFEKEAAFGPISVYKYKGCDEQYVDIPKVRPVIYTGKNWIEDFFQWYKFPEQNDVLLVPEKFVKDASDRDVFSHETENVRDLEAFRDDKLDRSGLGIKTHLKPFEISFTTNKIGLPHLIKVSYFPNWQVSGANGIYPVSPHLMLVIPREGQVVLTYGLTVWDKIGIFLTVTTLAFIILGQILSGWDLFNPLSIKGVGLETVLKSIERFFLNIRPYLFILTIVTVIVLMIGGALGRNRPVRAYLKGQKNLDIGLKVLAENNVAVARKYFEKAIRITEPIVVKRGKYDIQDLLLCMIVMAQSHEKLGETAEAENVYRDIINEYPYSRYVGEAYVRIGQLKMQAGNRTLELGLEEIINGNALSGRQKIQNALMQSKEIFGYYKAAIETDPYSIWAEYACDKIDYEKKYLSGKKPNIFSLCNQEEVKKSVETLLREMESVDFCKNGEAGKRNKLKAQSGLAVELMADKPIS